jgi:hypothetical protein
MPAPPPDRPNLASQPNWEIAGQPVDDALIALRDATEARYLVNIALFESDRLSADPPWIGGVKSLGEASREAAIVGELPASGPAGQELLYRFVGAIRVDATENALDRWPVFDGAECASGRTPMVAVDFVTPKACSAKRVLREWRRAMNELGSHFNGQRDARIRAGPDTPADSIARLQYENGQSIGSQHARRFKPGGSRAHDDDIGRPHDEERTIDAATRIESRPGR